jgi:signal peptidase I
VAGPRPDPVGAEPPAAAIDKWRLRRRELVVLAVLAVVIALLVKTFLLQAFYIRLESMVPTLHEGDRVLVEKISYRLGDPARGDIVVFGRAFSNDDVVDDSLWTDVGDAFRGLLGMPNQGHEDLVKRVIGVAGDRVEGRAGRVLVNGRVVEEPYLGTDDPTAGFPPVTVPAGEIFVMGDNRDGSEDSRSFGPVEVDDIVGRAFLLVWPPANLGPL